MARHEQITYDCDWCNASELSPADVTPEVTVTIKGKARVADLCNKECVPIFGALGTPVPKGTRGSARRPKD